MRLVTEIGLKSVYIAGHGAGKGCDRLSKRERRSGPTLISSMMIDTSHFAIISIFFIRFMQI